MSVVFSASTETRPQGATVQPWTLSGRAQAYLISGAVALACAWCYWPTVRTMAERWSTDPQYSHGFLVPLFAAVVLWSRRARLKTARIQPLWWGFLFLIAALVLRLAAASMDIEA